MAGKYDQQIKDILIKKGVVSQEVAETIVKEISANKDSFLFALLKKGIVDKQTVLRKLAEELDLEAIDLNKTVPEKEALDKVSARIAFYYHFLPLEFKEGHSLVIAVGYPFDIKTQDELMIHLGCNIKMKLALEEDIYESLKRYYGLGADTVDKISRSTKETDEAPVKEIENIEELAEDASIMKLVNQIIFEAYKRRATDIHIEPYRGEVSIRYRIDGVLYDANVSPQIKKFILPIISRIKIMCNLNIVEKRLPQDGRAIVKTHEQNLDLRISTLPTPYGESMVIRILPTKMLFSLEKLGFSDNDLKIVERLISKPNGIIFITGPTGSGKTTTLYAFLSKLNTRDRKIITIEDPIEYELKGVTQIQVAPDIGLDFAKGLRSILRHDPDVIMVGEVRDLETAEIAIRVSLTGHLVFSTLHTKDAASGIARLIDIGIEPYLVSSSIESFIAQRLVRVICPYCKEDDRGVSVELKNRIAQDLSLASPEELRVFKGVGCERCNFTGYLGRTGIYEILLMDEVIRDLVVERAQTEQIKKVAVQRGMNTLRQDGWYKVMQGITTPSEVMRVVSSEDRKFLYAEKSPLKESSIFLEQRAFKRLDARIRILYRIIKSKEELTKKGYLWDKFSTTKNISAGGVAFIAPEEIPIGSILEVNMELPDGKDPIVCLAKVVWVKPTEEVDRYEIGICFLDLTGSERTRINYFVREEKE